MRILNDVGSMISKDTLWKAIIEDFFPEMMAFFYPDSLDQLDLSEPEFLDNELQQLFPESVSNRRHADKLVKVRYANGPDLWLFIHIEVQGYRDKAFAGRMFQYFYRIFDRYRVPIEALALFTDKNRNYHPRAYEATGLKTEMSYRFHTYKLLDQDRESLEADSNPFALVMLTVWDMLHADKLKQADQDKDDVLMELKISLFRNLLSRGYDRKTIVRLLRFIKYYTSFADPEMNRKFDQVVSTTSNQHPMGINELVEQELKKQAFAEGKEKGKEEGKEEGKAEGKEEGKEELLRDHITSLLCRGFTEESVVDLLKAPAALVSEIAKELRQQGKME